MPSASAKASAVPPHRHVKVGVHHTHRNACPGEAQGATRRARPGHKARGGSKQEGVIADQEVRSLDLERVDDPIGHLVTEGHPLDRRRGVSKLQANGVPAARLRPGRPLPEPLHDLRDSPRFPHVSHPSAWQLLELSRYTCLGSAQEGRKLMKISIKYCGA
jgi:hypothetical protein